MQRREQPEGGLVAVEHHQGRRDGKPITYSTFSKNMKWWTDILYLELQEAAQRQAANVEAAQGFFKSSDL